MPEHIFVTVFYMEPHQGIGTHNIDEPRTVATVLRAGFEQVVTHIVVIELLNVVINHDIGIKIKKAINGYLFPDKTTRPSIGTKTSLNSQSLGRFILYELKRALSGILAEFILL